MMTYGVESRWGGGEEEPDERRMRQILKELDQHDPEHPCAWLTHDESGWCLDVYESGLVIWKNMKSSGEPRHLQNVSRKKALDLWLKLSRGEIEAIEREPWLPGQGPPLSDEERAEIIREVAQSNLELDRKFYDSLGAERPEKPCRHAGCQRGTVRFSVFCRVHHFENIRNHPCPFQD